MTRNPGMLGFVVNTPISGISSALRGKRTDARSELSAKNGSETHKIVYLTSFGRPNVGFGRPEVVYGLADPGQRSTRRAAACAGVPHVVV